MPRAFRDVVDLQGDLEAQRASIQPDGLDGQRVAAGRQLGTIRSLVEAERRRSERSDSDGGSSWGTDRRRRRSNSSSSGRSGRKRRKADVEEPEDEDVLIVEDDGDLDEESDDYADDSGAEDDEYLDLDSDDEDDSRSSASGNRGTRNHRTAKPRRSGKGRDRRQGGQRDGRSNGRTQRAGDGDGGRGDADSEDDEFWLDGTREDPDAGGSSVAGLPRGVYSEDEEANALQHARRKRRGVVWVHGGSESSLDRWFSLYQNALKDGAQTWVWIFVEGSGGGKLSFKRFSRSKKGWKTVYRVPAALSDQDGVRQVRREVLQVLGGYVPKLDRTVDFGQF